MAYSAVRVANEFLRLARQDTPPRALTPMQLVKLVYIAHGWSLALCDRPLVSDEIQAWQYGPVIPNLYAEVKKYGRHPITDELNEGIWSFAPGPGQQDRDLIADVYRKYSHFSGVQLSNLTHMKGTPWAEVYYPGGFNIEIPNGIISEHYRRLARERGAS